MNPRIKDVDEYIAAFPPGTQKLMKQLRATIRKCAPAAEELISYNMPAYKLDGLLVYFAAYERHIGFYPMPSVIQKFKKEISVYKNAKGSVQFPLDKPLPIELISKMIIFKAKENRAKILLKEKLKGVLTRKKKLSKRAQ